MVIYVDGSDFVSDCELAYGLFLFSPKEVLIAILSNLRQLGVILLLEPEFL